MKLILTCEHAFPVIPDKYSNLFVKDLEVLKTHEAYDPGAFDLFKDLSRLADRFYHQDIGRLLVETNRSVWHKNLFSRYTRRLSKTEKEIILDTYYKPYREKVSSSIESLIGNGENIFHLSIHSFTPVLNEQVRNADIGLLYDPQRSSEKKLAKEWKRFILEKMPDLNIRFNYPYLGKADGFTTTLRKRFNSNYIGVELEINQKWVRDNKMSLDIKKVVQQSLLKIIKRPELF